MSNIQDTIILAVTKAVKEVCDYEPEEKLVMVETPRDPKMGDYSTNIAMRLAKIVRKKPADIAGMLVPVIARELLEASSVTVAGPGFINFKMKESALSDCINHIIKAGDSYGKNNAGNGEKVLVEFVFITSMLDLVVMVTIQNMETPIDLIIRTCCNSFKEEMLIHLEISMVVIPVWKMTYSKLEIHSPLEVMKALPIMAHHSSLMKISSMIQVY